MKKLTFLFLFLSCVGITLLNAENQDTIILRDQTQIICNITDMTETMVSYTRIDRPKTIVFSTPMEKIEKIVFSDGTVAQITPTTPTTQPLAAPAENILPATNTATKSQTNTTTEKTVIETPPTPPAPTVKPPMADTQPITQYTETQTPVTQTATSQQTTTSSQKRIYRDNNEYMYDNKYISQKEVERIIRTNYAANEKWQKAKRKITAGWVMVGIGGACAIGSLACIPAGGIAVGSMCAGGLVFSSVGLGLALGSAKNYDQAIDIYNAQFDTTTELHIFADPNGVGIALRF